MAFPESFLRLILRWQLPGGEVANATCAWQASSPIVALDDATVDAFSTRSNSYWNSIQGQYADETSYVGCSVVWTAPDGHALARQDRPVAPDGGSSLANPLPNEVAACLSLRTASATRRTRGRMYLPAPMVGTLTSDARWTADFCTTVAGASATLLGDVVVGADTYTSVVASATGSLLTSILQVAMGNVPDAQRRRRDKLIEAYTTANV